MKTNNEPRSPVYYNSRMFNINIVRRSCCCSANITGEAEFKVNLSELEASQAFHTWWVPGAFTLAQPNLVIRSLLPTVICLSCSWRKAIIECAALCLSVWWPPSLASARLKPFFSNFRPLIVVLRGIWQKSYQSLANFCFSEWCIDWGILFWAGKLNQSEGKWRNVQR